ncbi:hypothetical protein LCGC14_3037320, partial [marine sediment metagenome]
RDLGPNAIAPRALRLLAAKPEVLQFIDGFMREIGIEDGLDIDKDSKGRMLIDSNVQRLLENNFLLLQRLSQAEDVIGAWFLPKLDEYIAKATGFESGVTHQDRAFKALSFMAGIKQREIDLDQTALWKFREIERTAQSKRARDRKKDPSYKTRQLRYQRREATRMRRLGF